MGKGESSDPPALHTVGSRVWLACDTGGWVKGEVVNLEGGGQKLRVKLEDGSERFCSQDEIPLQNPGKYGVEVRAAAGPAGARQFPAGGWRGGGWGAVRSPERSTQASGRALLQDMTTLNYLNEPGVLWNLKVRYQQDDIYTYTGSILIAVNPFAAMPHLYGSHMMEQYRGVNLGEISPHVYAIADTSYRQMRRENKSQSILVRGGLAAGGV